MRIVIAGAGEVGYHLAKMLSQGRHRIVIIDPDEDRLARVADGADVVPITGESTSISTLEQAGVAKADLFIGVSPAANQDVNLVSGMLAKRLGAKKVIARINNSEYLKNENRVHFTDLGIDLLFYPERIAAHKIIDSLKQTGTSEFMNFAGGRLQLVVFRLEASSPLTDKSFETLPNNHFDALYRPVAVAREGKTFIPRKNTLYHVQDLVFVLCTPEGVREVMALSGKDSISVRNLMIMGGGRVGAMVAKHLEDQVEQLTVVESDRAVCDRLSATLPKTLVIHGDARNTDLLLEENLSRMDAFVAVTSSSEANILSCMAAKSMGVSKAIAQVENLDYVRMAENIGVDVVINKKLIAASRIFRLTVSGNVQSVKYLNGTQTEVMELIVQPGSRITLGRLCEVDFPADAIVGGGTRGNQTFIATGETVIKPYDRLVVFALPGAVATVNKLCV